MKKVVVIAYSFPPVGGAGVQRPVKFVKYLRDFGWEPLVLTVENPSVPVHDIALLKDVPNGVKVFRARTLEPSYAAKQSFKESRNSGFNIKSTIKKIISGFMLPDLQILWWPGMTGKLITILRSEKPDCIFVTAPPFSTFIPTIVLGKLFAIPVILDYRDGWLFSRKNWEQANKNRMAYGVDAMLERFVLKNCHGFTAASQRYVTDISDRYSHHWGAKGETITNGYDPEDFIDREVLKPSHNGNEPFTMVYAGTVWSATSLNNLCTALKKLLGEQPALKERFRLKIFGRIVDNERDCLNSTELQGIVECHGYIEHEQAVREIERADVLLITLSDLPGADEIITAKAFEYMASGTHIFAVVPTGETRTILQENYNKLTVSDSGTIEDIYNGLTWIMTHQEAVRNTMPADVSSFSRKMLTGKLANVLNRVIQGN